MENEHKVFEAIQSLKDSVFGLKQSFSEYCFDFSNTREYTFNETKMYSFIDELAKLAQSTRAYSSSFERFIPLFLEMSLRFLAAACNPSDWQFRSIKKLAGTVYRESSDYKSTFDFMVEDTQKYLDAYWACGQFGKVYSEYSAIILDFDYDACVSFETCVKQTLERFIDSHNLNSLSSDFDTQTIIARITRTANLIQADLEKSRSMVKHDRE